MFIQYNVNPCDNRGIDCTVRAIATLLGKDWHRIYVELCVIGYNVCNMPSSKQVVNKYLEELGYRRFVTSEQTGGYTIKDFANEHRYGHFLLATDSHVVPVIDGNYIDTWDSGNEIALFYWEERK